MLKRDNIHHSWRAINGYNKAFNFCIGAREPGKTDSMWYENIYSPWTKDKKPWIYLVRKSVEITEALINSIIEVNINKWIENPVEVKYNKGNFKDGIVDVFLNKELFFRIVSLSIDLRRIKLAVVKNIKGVFMDEYIIDPRSQEKYIPNEAFKIKEAYTTWRRESDGMLKFYFAGNPYSLYNPLFVEWGVDVNKLSSMMDFRKGAFYVGDTYVIQWVVLNPLLREKLLKDNPLYQFDEDYNAYALKGVAVNDRNIRIGSMPLHYNLRLIVRLSDINIGIFQNNYFEDGEDIFYCKEVDNFSADRSIFTFDFESMVDRSILVSIDERRKLERFKTAFRKRQVVFSNINVYYMIKEVYQNI